MADNTILPVGTGGDTIRTISRAGVKTQVTQIDVGGEVGPESLVTSNNPLPVVPTGTTIVAGTVNVGNLPVVQQVSGTVTISNPLTGLPPLGSAGSAGALPVVIASDQVLPVQFNPDLLGPAGIDAALPVTLALDQPPIQVQTTPTGQQLMGQSVSVAVASDQSAVPVAGTFWPATQPVSVAGTLVVNAGIPPLGSAPSSGALPVVIATDQVVSVQLSPDTFGPAGIDAALPVTMALDQPPIAVTQTQLGQQPMSLSLPVTLASDQTSVVVTANQGVSPYNINFSAFNGNPVGVTNPQFVSPGSGAVFSTSRTWALTAASDAVTATVGNFPATQAVSAAALPLPTNAAQETGGNLAALLVIVTKLQQLIELNQIIAATLRADNVLLSNISGITVDPGDVLDDSTLQ